MYPVVGVGNAPWLSLTLIAGAFEQAFQELLDGMPVLSEFLMYGGVGGQLPMMQGKTVTFDFIKNRKKLAALKSRPNGIASVADLPQYGQVGMKALYTHEKGVIPPDMLALMRKVGENPGQSVPGAAEASMMLADLAKFIRMHTMRTWEQWCCNLLQGGTFTQVIDGANEDVVTGITATNIGGNFATASVNIPYLLNKAANEHRRQAGNPVSLVIYPDIVREYFAKNDYIQAWVNPKDGSLPLGVDDVPQAMKSGSWRDAREIFHISTFLDSADAEQNYWSQTKVAFVSLAPASRTLMCGTHPIIRPDLTLNDTEAFTRHMWSDNESGDLNIREVATGMFGLGDRLQISVRNINA